MSLHDHITNTDYDIELMLGEDYFLNIFQGLYDNNIIPNEIKINDRLSIKVNKPKNISIVTDSVVPIYYSSFVPDIILILPIRILTKTLQTKIGFSVGITNKEIIFKLLSLDIETEEFINSKAEELQISNLLIFVKEELKKYLNKNIPLSFDDNIISELTYNKLKDDGLYKKAFGLYINLNLNLDFEPFVIPYTNKPYIPEFIIRKNDLSRAKSFLPKNKSIAIYLSENTFRRIELNLWNKLLSLQKSKNIKNLKFETFSLNLKNNKIILEVKYISKDSIPDLKTIVIEIISKIEDEKISFILKIIKNNLEEDLFTTISSIVVSTLLGVEDILNNIKDSSKEKISYTKINKIFSSLSKEYDISKSFIFLTTRTKINNSVNDEKLDNVLLFQQANINSTGISMIGFNKLEKTLEWLVQRIN